MMPLECRWFGEETVFLDRIDPGRGRDRFRRYAGNACRLLSYRFIPIRERLGQKTENRAKIDAKV
ncbi:MAG: hypothetical protein PVH30_03525 [Desulfobacterales bacterium]